MKRIKICESFWDKLRGFMFRRKDEYDILIFKTELSYNPIHTLFCRFPLNIYWVDADDSVIYVALNVKPWTLSIKPNKKSVKIIESIEPLNLQIDSKAYCYKLLKNKIKKLNL